MCTQHDIVKNHIPSIAVVISVLIMAICTNVYSNFLPISPLSSAPRNGRDQRCPERSSSSRVYYVTRGRQLFALSVCIPMYGLWIFGKTDPGRTRRRYRHATGFRLRSKRERNRIHNAQCPHCQCRKYL